MLRFGGGGSWQWDHPSDAELPLLSLKLRDSQLLQLQLRSLQDPKEMWELCCPPTWFLESRFGATSMRQFGYNVPKVSEERGWERIFLLFFFNWQPDVQSKSPLRRDGDIRAQKYCLLSGPWGNGKSLLDQSYLHTGLSLRWSSAHPIFLYCSSFNKYLFNFYHLKKFFFFFFWSMWKSQGQDSNLYHNGDLSPCSGNVGSLTCHAPREFLKDIFKRSLWLLCENEPWGKD